MFLVFYLKDHQQTQAHLVFSLCYLIGVWQFYVLHFTFRPKIYRIFELIFVKGLYPDSFFGTYISSEPFVAKIIFLYSQKSVLLHQRSLYLCKCISRLFGLSNYLFVYFFTKSILSLLSQLNSLVPKLGSVSPPNSFICNTVLANYTGSFDSTINFRISLLISTKYLPSF